MLIAGEETDCAGKIVSFGRNCISAEIPPLECTVSAVPFLFACVLSLVFCVFCILETKCPTNRDNCEFP